MALPRQPAGSVPPPLGEHAFRVLADTAAEVDGQEQDAMFGVLCRNLCSVASAQGAALASFLVLPGEVELQAVVGGGHAVDLSCLPSRRQAVSEAWLASVTAQGVKTCRPHRDCLVTLFGSDLERLLPPGGVCHRLSCVRNGRLVLAGLVSLPAEIHSEQRWALSAYMGMAGVIVERAEAVATLARSKAEVNHTVEQRTRQLQGILGAATHAAIIATDPAGTITLFNAGAERYLGYQASEVVGQSTWLPFYLEREVTEHAVGLEREFGEVVPQERVLTERARRGGDDERTWTLVGKDRRRVVVSQTVTAIHDAGGELSGYLAVAHDIRDHLEVREQLRAARRAAETANRVKSEFLARMSHEIRTPLNGIIGVADMLGNTRLDREQSDYVRILGHSAQSLLDIVGTILDFSGLRAEQQSGDAAEFALPSLFDELQATYGPRAEAKGLTYTSRVGLGTPTQVIGDRPRLAQLLRNLLDNAIRFTDHGEICVETRCLANEDGLASLSFAVTDTGPGIATERLPELFQAFTQLDGSSTRAHGGTGLGLAIAQRLAELLGGRIAVESQVGRGSTFVVTVPLGTVPQTNAKQRLLVVGYEPEGDHSLQSRLAASWDVECVSDGAQALKSVREDRADVVALHLGGRKLDVAGTVRQIRRLERAWRILKQGQGALPTPIVFVGFLERGKDPAIWQAHGLGLQRVLQLPLTLAALARIETAAAGDHVPRPPLDRESTP
jgi:PAS domain S-box-containing protein